MVWHNYRLGALPVHHDDHADSYDDDDNNEGDNDGDGTHEKVWHKYNYGLA